MTIQSSATRKSGPRPAWPVLAAATVRRAFAEFLAIPTLIIAAFLGLSALMFQLDQMRIANGWPELFPGDHESVRALVETIASSIITVTSITFSLLLIAVQQGATSLTAQVYDQFLRRRANQAYFGYFTGLALYCLVVLAMTHPQYTPNYSATLAFGLTVVALYLLILLIYSTIDQMRPVAIVANIRDHTLRARSAQMPLLCATARPVPCASNGGTPVLARDSGYLALIDPAALRRALRRCEGAKQLVVLRSVGDYVSVGQPLARLHSPVSPADDALDPIRAAMPLRKQRDLDNDPAFGIEQLATIGWTSSSTSKSNPHPGRLACWNLRDLVASWCEQHELLVESEPEGDPLPIVYPDNVPITLLRSFESLAVVASESMQHQTLAAVYQALAVALHCIPRSLRPEVLAIADRSLSALGDQVLTAELDEAVDGLALAIDDQGMDSRPVRRARAELAKSRGKLNSRATRVPGKG